MIISEDAPVLVNNAYTYQPPETLCFRCKNAAHVRSVGVFEPIASLGFTHLCSEVPRVGTNLHGHVLCVDGGCARHVRQVGKTPFTLAS